VRGGSDEIVADVPVFNFEQSAGAELLLGLEPGSYRLEATADSGLKGSASFAVGNAEDASAPIEVELR
jgi:hypothetical protein